MRAGIASILPVQDLKLVVGQTYHYFTSDSALGHPLRIGHTCLFYFNVDISIFGLGLQIVLAGKRLGDEFDCHVHVFVPFKWCAEVEVFDVSHSTFCPPPDADDTILDFK